MNCDSLAPHYVWIERLTFGRALQRRRVAFLDEMADARRALVLGDGDGRFLAELAAANRAMAIDYVDLSAGMLERARRRAGGDRVRYLRADALTVPLDQDAYDLVVTHFFLDCFGPEEIRRLAARTRGAAGPEARWVVSEFRVPPGAVAGRLARGLIRLMYAFFAVATGLRTRRLTDHRPLLEAAGFRLREEKRHWGGLLVSELWRGGSGPITP